MAPSRRRDRRAGFAALAAAAVLVVVGAVVAVLAMRLPGSPGEHVATPLAPTNSSVPATSAAPTALPHGFNPATARPVFQNPGGGDAATVARAYLADRIPDIHAEVTPAPSTPSVQVFRWRSHTAATDNDHLPQGTVQLRQVEGDWSVVAATTDAVRFDSASLSDGRLDLVVAPTTPSPDDTSYLTTVEPSDSTATGGLGRISLHSPVRVQGLGDESVRILVQLVGGTVLSTTEFRLEPGFAAGGAAAAAGGAGGTTRWATSPGHSPLPAGFDLDTAEPVYVGSGSAPSVTAAYLRDRLPGVTVDVGAATTSGDIVEIAWKVHAPDGDAGHVWLRRAGTRWGVVAAGTSAVDMARTGESTSVAGHQAQVMGVVETSAGYGWLDVGLLPPSKHQTTAFASGLLLDGTGSFYGLVDAEPVVVRLQHVVGGRRTSITEFHLQPGVVGPTSCTARPEIRLTCDATPQAGSPPISTTTSTPR